MKKETLKIQDLKNNANNIDSRKAQIIDALLTRNLKGGLRGDPPPFGVHC